MAKARSTRNLETRGRGNEAGMLHFPGYYSGSAACREQAFFIGLRSTAYQFSGQLLSLIAVNWMANVYRADGAVGL